MTATVLLCLAVVALLGTVLVDQVGRGLLEAKRQAAFAEAGGAAVAQALFDEVNPDDAGARDRAAITAIERLSTRGGQGGSNEVLLVGSRPETPAAAASLVDYSSSVATRDDLPGTLRSRVQVGDGPVWTYLSMPVATQAGEERAFVPALGIGERVFVPGAGEYELYFLFPLAQEQQTLRLVQRAVAVAGLFLVLLVGLVAWLVARQVVTPVRMAARIAERLAAGRLEERMRVRGEDDLARLARSFNHMAESLQRQIGQLEDLSRLQRRFVSDVSHELRTPLTTVRMAADVLHEGRADLDPAAARSSELLQAQLEHFETLLIDLLEVSRFDAGAAVLEAEPHDLRALVQRVATLAEPLAQRKGSEVRLELPDIPCIAEVDPRRVARILRNLLVNAIEHGQGLPVVVSVAAGPDAVAVTVRDFGIGLSKAEIPRVFDRFWRADPARARTTGGTGLGLSISLEDAHLHGGDLEVWGMPGRGSRFRLTLPRRVGGPVSDSPLPLSGADPELDNGSLTSDAGAGDTDTTPAREPEHAPPGDSVGAPDPIRTEENA